MIFIYLAIFMVYCMPGLYLARSMYSEQIRTIRNSPLKVAPPKPPRPEVAVSEMLHQSGKNSVGQIVGVRCGILDFKGACNCSHRQEWIALKNGWADYDDWMSRYGNSQTTDKEPKPRVKTIYASVPVWPLVMGAQFIKGGAKNIPDYRLIERMEEINGITDPLKELN